MGFQEIVSLEADVTTALGGRNKQTGKENPRSAEGYFLGSKKVESRKAKSGFAYLHILQTSRGNLGVWGKTDMDRKLSGVAPGTMIRITHTGMQPTPNGEMYKFKVEVDSSNTIDVSGLAGAASQESEPESFDSSEDLSSDPFGSEEAAEEPAFTPPPRAASPAARPASAASVEAVKQRLAGIKR